MLNKIGGIAKTALLALMLAFAATGGVILSFLMWTETTWPWYGKAMATVPCFIAGAFAAVQLFIGILFVACVPLMACEVFESMKRVFGPCFKKRR